MKIYRSFIIVSILFIQFGCSTKNNILTESLASENPKIKNVMSNPDAFELQIIYTQILRDKNNKVSFKDFTYNSWGYLSYFKICLIFRGYYI